MLNSIVVVILLSTLVIVMTTTIVAWDDGGMAFATSATTAIDPRHCDQPGFPSCYSVGYHDGYKAGITICPTGHSLNYCAGWRAGAGNTTHCDRPGWPSCYSLGFQDGQNVAPLTACPTGHSLNYCAGWRAGAGDTTHCDRPGWPSCYDLGYQAGKKAISSSGAPCPTGHTQNFCKGYEAGTFGKPKPGDTTHCNRPGYPSCYSIGYQAGKKTNSSGASACPSGHSKNYCAGYEAGKGNSGGNIIKNGGVGATTVSRGTDHAKDSGSGTTSSGGSTGNIGSDKT